MGIKSVLYAIEPTQLLQTILAKEIQVVRDKYEWTSVQKCLQGSLLFSATLVGVGACASEIITLIPDILCKSGKKAIRGLQYVVNPAFLDRLYEKIPNRPTFADRIERVISQALGVLVSFLGTFFVFVIRNNWAFQLHQNLHNYSSGRPLPVPPVATKTPAREAGAQPPSNRPQPTLDSNESRPLEQTQAVVLPAEEPIVQVEAAPPVNKPGDALPPILQTLPPLPMKPFSPPSDPTENLSINLADETSTRKRKIEKNPSVSESSPISFVDAISKRQKKMVKNLPQGTLRPKKDKSRYLNTIGKALASNMENRRRSMVQSEKYAYDTVGEYFTIKANEITLQELEEIAGIQFEITEEQNDQKLSDFLYDEIAGLPEVGVTHTFQGFKLKIMKLTPENDIERVNIKFIEEENPASSDS